MFAVSALRGWQVRDHGNGRIWLDNLRCTGNERSLADCPHNGWGNHNCRPYDNAGVECSPTGRDILSFPLSSPHLLMCNNSSKCVEDKSVILLNLTIVYGISLDIG